MTKMHKAFSRCTCMHVAVEKEGIICMFYIMEVEEV